MELRKINMQDARAQWEYTTALPADENGLTNPYHGVCFEEYMQHVLRAMLHTNLQEYERCDILGDKIF